jgi:PAS domain S-box-containing protein
MFSKATKFENLLEAVPDALVGMDQSGAIWFVNHQTELLFDYGRGDLLGRSIESLVPEVLGHVYSAYTENFFAVPGSRSLGLDLELTARNRSGAAFPVNVSLSKVDTGDVLLEIAAASDATTKERAFETAQRMTAIVDNCDDAIIGKTLLGIITSWNPAAERMYGYSGDEAIGRSVHMLAPFDRAFEISAILDRIRSGEPVDHFVTSRLRKDGTELWVSLSVSPIRSEDGKVVGAGTIARDVTAARQSSLLTARAMLESSHDSLVSISEEGKITDANEATVKVTGVPRDELLGTAFSSYFTDPESANRIYRLAIEEGMAVDYPLSIRHRDGTSTEVLYNASRHLDADGTVLGVFAAARDLTRQVQAQTAEEERQAQAHEQLAELQRFQRLTICREVKMFQMKVQLASLREENQRLRRLLPEVN